MPTHIEQELGLAPTTHRFRRWFRKLVSEEERSLDPLTVNYEAWRSVRHGVRQWPHYQEAPNYVEVLVSPEDWDDYWGIDSGRKESGVAAYVRARAAEKGYWMAGEPQVSVMANDAINEHGRSLDLDAALLNAGAAKDRSFRVPSILGDEGGDR